MFNSLVSASLRRHGKIGDMKNLLKDKLVRSAVALVVILGFVNSLGIVGLSMSNQSAQVFGSTLFFKPETHTYYVADNDYGQQIGMTFKQNKYITIKACGAGAGGGGGGRGWEDGDGEGNGGGGGGGGGSGQCNTRSFKLRAGDTVRWLVGTGGTGGSGGVLDTFTGSQYPNEDTVATYGQNGGTTYVSINGIDVMTLSGGHGGAFGSNAMDNGMGAGGGWGGSIIDGYPQSSWHAGHAGGGQWDNPTSHCPNGGRGGRGETDAWGGDQSTSGSPGYSSFNSYDFGGHGGDGQLTFGGGGGGGGPCRWYWYAVNGNYNNSIRNRGGWGGRGGDGYVTISW